MKTQVICFGEVLWDILPSGRQPGGAPLNVAYHLHKMGIAATIMSRTGDDAEGRELRALLSTWELDTDSLQTDKLAPTSQVIARMNEDNEVTYEIVYPVAWDYITGNKRFNDRLNASTYLIYGSLAARSEVTRDTLFELLEAGGINVFDVNIRPPFFEADLLRQLLLKADFVKFNQAELGMVSTLFDGPGYGEEQVRFIIKAFGLKGVIVTKGASGASCFIDGKAFHTPGRPVAVQDTIGSGDAFLAAFVAGLCRGEDPADNLENAVAMGAFVATQRGGCPAYVTDEFLRFKTQLFNNHQLPTNNLSIQP